MSAPRPATAVRGGLVIATPGLTPASPVSSSPPTLTPPIAGGRFVAGVEPDELLLDDPAAIVVPALADGHDHGLGWSALALGVADGPLETWLPALRQLPAVDPEAAAVVYYGQLLRSGVTAAVHLEAPGPPDGMVDRLCQVAAGARGVGATIAIAVPLHDRSAVVYGHADDAAAELVGCGYGGDPAAWTTERIVPPSDQVALVEEVADRVEGEGVTVQFGPLGPPWVSTELLSAVAESSARTGRRVHMHLLESRRQRAAADAEHPEGVVTHLDRLGLLSERLSVAHGVRLRPDEMDLLAARGVTVVVNASSNLRLRCGVAPASTMLQRGLRVASGLDGNTLDDDLDGWRETRLFHLLNLGTGMDDAMTRQDAFRAAMDHARFAVTGERGPWGLGPGRPADVVLLDGDRLLHDVVDPRLADVPAMVLARATRRHVRHVVAGGRVVVRDGDLVGGDVAAATEVVRGQVRSSAAHLLGRRADVADLQSALRRFYRGTTPREPSPGASG